MADEATERIAFLAEAKTPHRVRPTIAASWRRSRDHGVAADRVEVPFVAEPDVDTPLARSAEPVLQRLFEKLHDTVVSLILTDPNGLVLSRRTHDGAFQDRLDRVLLAPGFSFAERYVGTNGIGTALEAGTATQVFGHEHYAENLETFACAAVPIHDRVAQRLAGVMNLTCRSRDADPLLLTLAETTAEQIEYALQADAGMRELRVLQAYRQACRRTSGLVLAVSADAVTVNDRARTELAPSDQSAVLAHANEVGTLLAAGARRTVQITLPSGVSARLYVHQVDVDDRAAGLVVRVRPMSATPVATPASVMPAELVGESAQWRHAYGAAVKALRTDTWLAVTGEPGVGKLALLRGVLGRHRYVVIDPANDPSWRDALRAGSAVVLRHPERSADWPDLVVELRGTGAWVGAVCAADAPDELLAQFPRAVQIPPLRLRLDDLPALVTFLLRRSGHPALTCSPDAMRLLLRAVWPGNVAQLRQVLHEVVRHRRSGTIEPEDLPPELHALSRRVLSPIESLERDAIVRALSEAQGNKADAAKALGISRATVYRRIHEYGIVSAG